MKLATIDKPISGPDMPSIASEQWMHGERRQLTVMTCDLVSSTELSTRFDAEDLAQIVSAFQSCCEHIVRQFDGYVARFTGDGLKAYFGYPRAHEYDPERAVRAALALVSAVKELKLRPALVLSTRVGIATGDVVVGEVIGTGEARERTVVGQAPNLAARLQDLGSPNSITIADTTKRLIGSLFEYADLGQNRLKGFPEPIQAWCVLAEGPTGSHFEAVRTEASLSPFVGREEELTFLRHRWLQVKAGNGQVLVLSGEPGVGKSRLAMAFRNSLVGESFWDIRHHCSPYHQNSSFYPIIKQLEQSSGISHTDTADLRLQKLESLLAESKCNLPNAVPLFAALLSIPIEAPAPPLDFSPAQLRRRILNALEARLVGLGASASLLVVFEDVQWADPSTLEFLERLICRAADLPLLLLVTARPEVGEAWGSHARVTSRVLARLTRRDSELIVGALDTGMILQSKSLEQILDYSDGLPLFVEELTKAALEAQREQAVAPEHRTGPVSPFRVPQTLHDSLLARLDRLGPYKRVAQTAAVIGRSFTFKLINALFPGKQDVLIEVLQGLVQTGLIVDHGRPPETTYTFAHALLQETANACLLTADRRAIHQHIAQVLERDFPETVSSEPELLALHYTGAGIIDSAISCWRQAAERALERSANLEAAHHYEQALSLLDTLPQDGARDERELTLRNRLGATLTTIKGFAAPEVAAVYERARRLCDASLDPSQRFSVLRGLWSNHFVRAEWETAQELAGEMLALGQERHSQGYELEGHRALGMAALWRGHFTQARDHFEQGLQLYDPEQHAAHAFQYGNEPGIACLVHDAFALWVLGYPDRALDTCRMAVILARRLGHPFSLTQSLIYTIFIHERRGEADLVRKAIGEAKTLAVEHGFPFWAAEAGIMQGWAMIAYGRREVGIRQMLLGIADLRTTGAKMDQPRWLAMLADAYGHNNQTQEALKVSSDALAIVEKSGECFYQARLLQLRGELLLKEGAHRAASHAEACFEEALAVARRQQARSWELAAATSLARLWCAQLKRREARNLLAPVFASFAEGFATSDLRNARALLDELGMP